MNDRENIVFTASMLLDRFFWYKSKDEYFLGINRGMRISGLLLVGRDKEDQETRELRKEAASEIRSNRARRRERRSKAA